MPKLSKAVTVMKNTGTVGRKAVAIRGQKSYRHLTRQDRARQVKPQNFLPPHSPPDVNPREIQFSSLAMQPKSLLATGLEASLKPRAHESGSGVSPGHIFL